MHPLAGTELARTIVRDLQNEAAPYRVEAARRRPAGVRRILGRVFVSAGNRLMGV
jgi:hypothetical protein